jgi:hypothetical protein
MSSVQAPLLSKPRRAVSRQFHVGPYRVALAQVPAGQGEPAGALVVEQTAGALRVEWSPVTALEVNLLRHRFFLQFEDACFPLLRSPDGSVEVLCRGRRFCLAGGAGVSGSTLGTGEAFPVGAWIVLATTEPVAGELLLDAVRAAATPWVALENIVGEVLQHLGGRAPEDNLAAVLVWREASPLACRLSCLARAG